MLAFAWLGVALAPIEGRADAGDASDAPEAHATGTSSVVCPAPRPTLGPADAPVRVLLFVDPTAASSRRLWAHARRLVAEHEGLVRLELGVAQSHLGQATATRDVQAFALAAMAAHPQADPGPLLDLLARRGWAAVGRQLGVREDRAQLAAQLGLTPADMERYWAHRRCLERQVHAETTRLHELERVQLGGNTVPLPVSVVLTGDTAPMVRQEDGDLDALRIRLDRAVARWRRIRRGTETVAPAIDLPGAGPRAPIPAAAAPSPLRDEPAIGLTLGNFGAPHHLAIYAESETSTMLTQGLAAGLALRREDPAALSIQIVARGGSTRSVTFRRRLCAARAAGLGPAYAAWLAEPADVRDPGVTRAVVDRLDVIADEIGCPEWEGIDAASAGSERPNGRAEGFVALPRGLWLDGQLLQSADLPVLGHRRRRLGNGAAPWLWPGLVR